MGFFSGLARAFTLPSGMNSLSDFLGTGGSNAGAASTPPPMLTLPPLPPALAAPPTVEPPAALPSPGATPAGTISPIKLAGAKAANTILGSNGRSSTILTTKKKRSASAPSAGTDAYSSSVL